MRLLADENLPLPTIEALQRSGHDVTWARTDFSGTSDSALLDIAEDEGRILLTLDKDFWQIAIQRQNGHASVVTADRVLMVWLRRPERQ